MTYNNRGSKRCNICGQYFMSFSGLRHICNDCSRTNNLGVLDRYANYEYDQDGYPVYSCPGCFREIIPGKTDAYKGLCANCYKRSMYERYYGSEYESYEKTYNRPYDSFLEKKSVAPEIEKEIPDMYADEFPEDPSPKYLEKVIVNLRR